MVGPAPFQAPSRTPPWRSASRRPQARSKIAPQSRWPIRTRLPSAWGASGCGVSFEAVIFRVGHGQR
eukprot:3199310-Lingulodinium_polyedra.AAC.1